MKPVNLIFARVVADSLHEVSISARPATVYDAWATERGLPSWRTDEVPIYAGIGGIDVFLFEKRLVAFHLRIKEQIRGTWARWTGMPGDKMSEEWVDTRVEVDIKASEAGARMRFSHTRWRRMEGADRVCNSTWGRARVSSGRELPGAWARPPFRALKATESWFRRKGGLKI